MQLQKTIQTVEMVYDNMIYKTPGKTKKYNVMMNDFAQATLQTQGASAGFLFWCYSM